MRSRASCRQCCVGVGEGIDGVLAGGIEFAEEVAEVVGHDGDEQWRDHGADEAVEVAVGPGTIEALAKRGQADEVGEDVDGAQRDDAAETQEERRDEERSEGEVEVGAAPTAAQVDGEHRERQVDQADDEDVVRALALLRVEPHVVVRIARVPQQERTERAARHLQADDIGVVRRHLRVQHEAVVERRVRRDDDGLRMHGTLFRHDVGAVHVARPRVAVDAPAEPLDRARQAGQVKALQVPEFHRIAAGPFGPAGAGVVFRRGEPCAF